MNVITKLMYSIHRILGTLLCILFLMWFLSAFVMMYHRFPRVSAKEKMQKLEMLSQAGDSLPDISSVTARLPHGVKVRSTMLNLNAGHPEFSFSTTKGTFHFLADSTISPPSLDSEHLHRTAALWCSSPINRIDTLHSLDQWIPFAELKRKCPSIKYTLPMMPEHNSISVRKTVKPCSSPTETNAFGHGWEPSPTGCTSPGCGRTPPFGLNRHLAHSSGLSHGHCRHLGDRRCMA